MTQRCVNFFEIPRNVHNSKLFLQRISKWMNYIPPDLFISFRNVRYLLRYQQSLFFLSSCRYHHCRVCTRVSCPNCHYPWTQLHCLTSASWWYLARLRFCSDTCLFLPPANEIFGKVMLLLMFVCPQRGVSIRWGICLWREGVSAFGSGCLHLGVSASRGGQTSPGLPTREGWCTQGILWDTVNTQAACILL